ncbi:MAG: hypothetical protein ACJAV6_000338 [Candidatus Paceibacteria bacterium]|jgi:hypothetical protein
MESKFEKVLTSKIGKTAIIISVIAFAVSAILLFLEFDEIGLLFLIPILAIVASIMLVFGISGFRNIYSIKMRGAENIPMKIILLIMTIASAWLVSGILLHFWDYLFTLPEIFFTESVIGCRKIDTEKFRYTTIIITVSILTINWFTRYHNPIIT